MTHELKPRILVFGVGGAGGNAVDNMIEANLQGVEFIVANTDAQALSRSKTETVSSWALKPRPASVPARGRMLGQRRQKNPSKTFAPVSTGPIWCSLPPGWAAARAQAPLR